MNKKTDFQAGSEEPIKNKKTKKTVRIIAIILIPILLIVGIGIKFITDIFNFKHDKITSNPEELGFTEKKEEDIINIALFGVDGKSANTFDGLSDVMIILSVNKSNNKIKLTSVLRDSFVPVEKDGKTSYCKINSVYPKYGPEFAVNTLNKVFKLDISEYIVINFTGMVSVVDMLGGIEVTLTEDEVEYVNGGVRDINKIMGIDQKKHLIDSSGKQTLNGVQATAYARIRKVSTIDGVSNDFGRTDRQRYILEQIFKKAKNLSLSKMIDLAKAVSPLCKTSLTYFQMIDIGSDVLLGSPSFEQTRIPQMNWTMPQPTSDYGSILYYDLDFATEVMHAFIYEDIAPEEYVAKNGIKKNNWY